MCIKFFLVKFTSSDLNGPDRSICIYYICMLKTKMNENIGFLIKKREDAEIKHLKDAKTFIEYSQ